MDWVAWGTWAGTVCAQPFGPTTLRNQSLSVRMLVGCPALHASSIAYQCSMLHSAQLPLGRAARQGLLCFRFSCQGSQGYTASSCSTQPYHHIQAPSKGLSVLSVIRLWGICMVDVCINIYKYVYIYGSMTAFALVNMYKIRKQLMVSSEPQALTPLEQDTSSAYCHFCQCSVLRIKQLPWTIPGLYVLHSCAYLQHACKFVLYCLHAMQPVQAMFAVAPCRSIVQQ